MGWFSIPLLILQGWCPSVIVFVQKEEHCCPQWESAVALRASLGYTNRLRKLVLGITMACPKKKTSKSKRSMRRAVWKRQAALQAQRALSIGKSILTERAQGFYFPEAEEEENEDKQE